MALRSAIAGALCRGAGFLALLLSCFVGQLFAAAPNCNGTTHVTKWSGGPAHNNACNGANWGSPEGAGNCLAAAYDADDNIYSWALTGACTDAASGTANRWNCPYRRTHNSGSVTDGFFQVYWSCVPIASACSQAPGTVKKFRGVGSGTDDREPPSTTCLHYCSYATDTSRGVVALPGGSENVVYWGSNTGTVCNTTATPESTTGALPEGGEPVVGPYEPNTMCGTFNGENICVGSIGDNECARTPGGNGVCVIHGAGNSVSTLTSPQAPDNGAPGTPAPPTAIAYDTGNDIVITYYDQSVINNSTHQPGPGNTGGGDGDGDGDGDGEGEGNCGGEGQDPCDVKIDESGVPDEPPGTMAGTGTDPDTEGFGDDVAGAAGAAPQAGWGLGDMFPDLEESACETIEVSFFGIGESREFPTPVLCTYLDEKVKPLLAFFIYAITALGIIMLGIRASAPRA